MPEHPPAPWPDDDDGSTLRVVSLNTTMIVTGACYRRMLAAAPMVLYPQPFMWDDTWTVSHVIAECAACGGKHRYPMQPEGDG